MKTICKYCDDGICQNKCITQDLFDVDDFVVIPELPVFYQPELFSLNSIGKMKQSSYRIFGILSTELPFLGTLQ